MVAMKQLSGFSVMDADELFYINGGCGNEGKTETTQSTETKLEGSAESTLTYEDDQPKGSATGKVSITKTVTTTTKTSSN